jgi:predicted Zn finger-like uncharacterized protein
MTVQCPRCRTQYKIPTARINDPRPVFKCTRCSLVFSSAPERGARGKAKEDKNLPLPFSTRKESPGRATPPAPVVDEDAPTIRSVRDAAIEEDETLVEEEETEELEAEEDEDGADEQDEEDSADEEEDEEDDAAEDEEEEDEEEDDEPEEAPAKPARRPRRSRAADEDDATEPAFARAERERAAAERERERAAAERERERERIAAEKERAAAEKERARVAAEKERERQRAAAEREKERARVAAEKERARAAEARRRERELELEDDEDVDDDGPDDLGEDDDEPKRPVLRASDSKQRRAPINPRRGIRSANGATPSRSPLRTIAMGVAGVVAAYGIATLWLSRSSEAAIQTLSQVPVLGQLLGGDHLLVWRLQLTDVDGALDQIKGGRPAYVVSGRAVNTSNEDLRVIEIEGRLLVNGVEQRRQTVYAANQQRKTIQDLSPPEVEMLLRLEPNRRFVIRPGESASFLLVFPNPPPGTTEVTCRVLDARSS